MSKKEEIEYLQVVPRGQLPNKEKWYPNEKMRELFPRPILGAKNLTFRGMIKDNHLCDFF